ncbi:MULTISPECIES: hypothetical protein [Pseudomonas putida group]|uniref:hypothetical protein n=1 Tax=Pseudomonas TaxID=286 RepID=UPI001BAEA658|nr:MULTISPECIES: hypothetical protein [Pseudomonas putida group]QUG87682.1 hypothetical protein GR140_02560 [Pseudomonas putida]
MSTNSLEEEMRRALFGGSSTIAESPKSMAQASRQKPPSGYSSKLRVELHVTNIFEGDYEVVHYESPVLSALVAEMEARKKYGKKYRYVTVISTTRI